MSEKPFQNADKCGIRDVGDAVQGCPRLRTVVDDEHGEVVAAFSGPDDARLFLRAPELLKAAEDFLAGLLEMGIAEPGAIRRLHQAVEAAKHPDHWLARRTPPGCEKPN